jgi:drug/metabolite transporter (DMT)-like permease
MTLRAAIGWLLYIVVETSVQVVFKIAGSGLDGAHGLWPMVLHALTAPWVLGGFGLYFIGFLLWMTILKDADLGRAFPMTASVYLTTLAAAVFLFHEHLTPLRVIGIVTIMVGVGVLASDENSVEVVPSPSLG